MSQWPFSVLEVSPDAEPREIKRAYARKLKTVHPEDDPVGFQALREAYEAAASGRWAAPMAYADDSTAQMERPSDTDAAPMPVAATAPRTLVPASLSAEEELREFERVLYDAICDPDASDAARLQALDAVLSSPALENVGQLTRTEAWIGGLIAEFSGPTDVLIDRAVARFGWQADQDRWDVPWFVASVLQRQAALAHVDRLHDPKGPYHAGYRLLQKPPGGGLSVFLASRKARAILELLDRQPGLVAEFDYEILNAWSQRLDALPFNMPTRKNTIGLAALVVWIALIFISPKIWPDGDERAPVAERPAVSMPAAAEDCRRRARARKVAPAAVDSCTRAAGADPASLAIRSDHSLMLLRKGSASEARLGWDAVLARHPTEARALYGRGLARIAVGDVGGLADVSHALAIRQEVEREFAGYGLARPVGAAPKVMETHIFTRPPPHLPVTSRPDWAAMPDAATIERFYPPAALRTQTDGVVKLNCLVDVQGRLQDCRVREEAPQDRGFADAALAMAKVLRMRPAMNNGEPVGGVSVTFPVRFGLR